VRGGMALGGGAWVVKAAAGLPHSKKKAGGLLRPPWYFTEVV
jgi:hypothetical protein